MKRLVPLVAGIALPVLLLWAAFGERAAVAGPAKANAEVAALGPPVEKVEKSDAEWQKLLTPEQFDILRRGGTERAGSSALDREHGHGTFVCAACGLELFRSEDKFDSGTGWPSFTRPYFLNHVEEHAESSFGGVQTEIRCARCGGHLGHVFGDGPHPTYLRYCMNGDALLFSPKEAATAGAAATSQ